MKQTQKGMVPYSVYVLIAIIALLIIGVGIYVYGNKNVPAAAEPNQNATSTSNVNTSTTTKPVAVNGKCGLNILTPLKNAEVSFPLTIKGKIDNTNREAAGCSWGMFEANAGSAQLLYFSNANKKWNPLGVAVPIPVDTDNDTWMSDKATFSLVMNFNNDGIGLPAGTPLKIVFSEDDPSGRFPVDTYELPVILKSVNNSMSLSLYLQDKEAARTNDCRVTKKVTYQVPKTAAVADASLKILFGDELAKYGIYKSVSISNNVAKVMLQSDMTQERKSISGLSSCEKGHLMAVLTDTLTQYNSIKSVVLVRPDGSKIEL